MKEAKRKDIDLEKTLDEKMPLVDYKITPNASGSSTCFATIKEHHICSVIFKEGEFEEKVVPKVRAKLKQLEAYRFNQQA